MKISLHPDLLFFNFSCLQILACHETCLKARVKYTPRVTIYSYIMFLLDSQHDDWNMLCILVPDNNVHMVNKSMPYPKGGT